MPSKFGLHCLNGGPQSADLISAGCRVIKYVQALPPDNLPADALIIYRWVQLPDNINGWFGMVPEVAAARWVDLQQSRFAGLTKRAYIEGPNENDCENASQAAWFSRFEIARMQLMEARGYKCVIGNFGTGRPSVPLTDPLGVDIWTALLPMLRYAKANGHLLGMHEYDDHLSTWWMLRYRRVYSWLPSDAQPNLVITEWGLETDNGPFRTSGWSSDQYLSLIKAYDTEVSKDAYHLGYALFTLGDDGNWGKFDIANTSLIPLLIDYLKETPMAKFSPGQTVWVNSFANVQDGNGQKIGSLDAGTQAVILDGPRTLPGKGNTIFWKIQAGAIVGNVNENALGAVDTTSAPYLNRRIDLRLAHHDGDPHPIYADKEMSRYLKLDSAHDSWLNWLAGGFVHAVSYWWTGAEYLFEVEKLADGGVALWGENAPTGWVAYKHGNSQPPMNRLEVAVRDGQPAPDFELRPAVWPPQTEPPTPPQPPQPPTPPCPEVAPATGVQIDGFEGATKPAPAGVSGLLPAKLDMTYLDSTNQGVPGQSLDGNGLPRWYPPEVIVQQLFDHPAKEGLKIFHFFGAWKPIWTRFTHQDKLHLKPGHGRVSCILFFDPVISYDGGKVYGKDPISTEFRMGLLSATDSPLIDATLPNSAFINGNDVPPGCYKRVYFNVISNVEGDFTPFLEVRMRHGLTHNGGWVDDWRYEWTEDGVTPPPPPPPPDEPPVDTPSIFVRFLRWLLDFIQKLLEKWE